MKKAMILKREVDSNQDMKDISVFEEYAKKNDLKLSGIIKYPLEITLYGLQKFAELLKSTNQDVFLVNDGDIFISDIVTKGKLFEVFDRNDITVIHTDLDMELKDMYTMFPYGMIENMKKELHERNSQKPYRVAVIDSHDIDINQNDSLDQFLKEHRIDKVVALQMNVFHKSMKPILNQAIKDNDVNLVIVLDEELLNQEFQEYIRELEAESIDIKYSDDLQNEMENQFQMGGMFVS